MVVDIGLLNRELPMKIVFHAFLGSQGRIYIPKAIVERYEPWEGTPIDVTITIRNHRESSFPTAVKKGGCSRFPNEKELFTSYDTGNP